MKNKLRVKTFAEMVSSFHSGQIVFLKSRHGLGYFCRGVGSYGFEGWHGIKELKPLSENKKDTLINYIKSAKEELEFYKKALLQIAL